jgi:hypothetical protein
LWGQQSLPSDDQFTRKLGEHVTWGEEMTISENSVGPGIEAKQGNKANLSYNSS